MINKIETPFAGLSPERVLDAASGAGLDPDGRLFALNSYENRVYQLGAGEATLVLKFYRPGRWSDGQILEEHRFAAELAEAELPVAARRFADQPACVVAVGTAMTIDLMGAEGRHRGGAIIPGPTLMIASLLEGTSGIRRRAQGGARGRGSALFGRSTRAAVEQGARYAAAAAVDRAVSEASALVGRTPQLVMTGGGASVLRPLIHSRSLVVPDLVLEGLAAWSFGV